MVQLSSILCVVTLSAAAIATTNAHPGEHHHTRSLAEVAQRRLFQHNAHRSLAACSNKEASRQLNAQAAARREAKIAQLRAELQNRRRDRTRARDRALAAADVVAISHKSNLTDISPTNVDTTELFGSDNKCVLEPEVTQGPYYVTGELIRNDVRESEPGIDLYAELQFIDVTSCAAVPDYYVDFWHSNSTGVYAGVVASGNGNGDDLSNYNTTHGRGLYPTDDEGVVQFITKFPGHYDGRATHIHILGNHGGSVLANNTYSGGGAASVGQIFFDQDLLTEVNAISPYSTITDEVVVNADDSIFVTAASNGFDPIMQYVLLGDSLSDGLFAWISVGVDTSISKTVSAAATWTANGGVATSGGFGGGMGMGSGAPGGMGSGTFPGSGMGGMPPSGSATGTVAPSTTTTPTTSATGSTGAEASTPATTKATSCK